VYYDYGIAHTSSLKSFIFDRSCSTNNKMDRFLGQCDYVGDVVSDPDHILVFPAKYTSELVG